jgi:hypothetical protein
MAQAYSDPTRESDPHALPNIEIFHQPDDGAITPSGAAMDAGWYWWACFPGCLPDGDPIGPFDTAAEALADAREGNDLDIVELR